MNRFQRLCYQQAKIFTKLAKCNGYSSSLYTYYKYNLALNRYMTIDELHTKLAQFRTKYDLH